MGSLLLGIILVLMSSNCLSGEYITQSPPYLDLVEGDSGTISCTVQSDLDIRSLSFIRRFTIILQLCIYSTNGSNLLSFSGTFQNIKCERKTETGEKSTCTIGEEPFNSVQGDHCSPPPENSLKKIFNCGDNIFASIWVDPSYGNRIDLSGTIRKLKLTLQNVTQADSDSYSCRGNATGFIGDFTAYSTQVSVTKGSMPIGTIIGSILGVCLISLVVFMYWKRETIRTKCCRQSSSTSY
ncbi:uncharacterized protein [Phyllobates terribilis]|uniref:uncharacterized protein n=1 Tax=Phyllobates terribilis TaxID=111132 RepID=UPI003CCABE05